MFKHHINHLPAKNVYREWTLIKFYFKDKFGKPGLPSINILFWCFEAWGLLMFELFLIMEQTVLKKTHSQKKKKKAKFFCC